LAAAKRVAVARLEAPKRGMTAHRAAEAVGSVSRAAARQAAIPNARPISIPLVSKKWLV
jgi:hypothetical protein